MVKPEYIEMDMLAPAKINLGLDVGRKVVDGRHPLTTVMQSISLCDKMHVTADWDPPNADVQIDMTFGKGIDHEDVPLESNLVYKAIMAFCDYIGKPMGDKIHIYLQKNIPTKSGLGGGSSDCAAAIKLMAMLYRLDPYGEEAVAVARSLGSDVAFFIDGGCAVLGGFGDVLEKRFDPPKLHLAIARPSEGLGTPDVYRTFDQMEDAAEIDRIDQLQIRLLRHLDSNAGVSDISKCIGNSLQRAACSLNGGVSQIISEFNSLPGVLSASVSGSGSACYAICEDATAAASAVGHMQTLGFWSVACDSVTFGAGWDFPQSAVC